MTQTARTCLTIGCLAGLALTPVRAAAELIEVAAFGKNQPIGLTVSPASNRVFVSFPHKQPFLYALAEIVDGKRIPFPDEAWNQFNPDDPASHFVNVQDLYADRRNQLWVLDSSPAGSASKEGKFKLVRIDLATNKVLRSYRFEDLPKEKSGLNDVRVDHSHHLAYLSDPSLKAIVVLDLGTGKSRVVLKDDPSTVADPNFILHLDGKDVVGQAGNAFVSNVNGIALSPDERYFYYHAINRTVLFRIETKFLADPALQPEALSAKVERVAENGVSHGMIAGPDGSIYSTHSPDHSIRYVTPDGKVHTLVTDERLSWPDSLGIGDDGYLYLTAAQLNRQPGWNHGEDRVDYPFRAYKVRLPERP